MQVKDCILTRRSVRRFTDAPVPRDLLEQVVAQAAYAPSWKNTQCSRYLAIEDRAVLEEICRTYSPSNAHIISNAPVVVAQTFVHSRSGFDRDGTFSTDREGGWQCYDCGIAAQTFCLAAHDLGLGTVILGVFDRKGLERYLQIPQEQELMALIALGVAQEVPPAPKRKDVDVLLQYRPGGKPSF